MAERMITKRKRAVLQAGLDHSERTPVVSLLLDGYEAESDVGYWGRRVPLKAFGLSKSARVPDRVVLPPAVVREVQWRCHIGALPADSVGPPGRRHR